MTKHLFFCLSLLLLAGIVSMPGIAPDANAALTIDSIEVWVDPDMVGINEEDNTPTSMANARKYGATGPQLAPTNRLVKFATPNGFANGTLSGGTRVTASNAGSTTVGVGQTIAIVINMSATAPDLTIHHGNIQILGYDGWAGEASRHLTPSRLIEASHNVHLSSRLSNASLVYPFTVRGGDYDTDGGWFEDDTPFSQWSFLTTQFAGHRDIAYPIVDGRAPKLAAVSTYPVRYVTDAPRGPAPSRYHKVRQECLRYHDFFGDAYTQQCDLVQAHGWALAADVNLDNSPEAAYYREGDTIAIQVTFDKPVIADPGVTLQLQTALSGEATFFELTDADRTDRDNTLTFRYKVKAGDRRPDVIHIDQKNLWHNTRTAADRLNKVLRPDAKHIRDLAGNTFDYAGFHFHVLHNFEVPLRAYLIREPTLNNFLQVSYRQWERPLPPAGEYAADYATAVIKHLVDTIPPTVWVAGLVKNGETHTEDRRNAIVNLDPSAAEHPVTDFTAAISEPVVQSDAFEVEFRFTNHHAPTKTRAEEIGETFEAGDIVITDASGNTLDWQVDAPVYIGLDHRAPQNYTHWNAARDGHSPGDAKNSASFLVYKARITPGLDFHGDVTLQIPAGAVVDTAGNKGLVSNTLTVPIDTRLTLAAAPEIVAPPAGTYTLNNEIQVNVPFEKTGLTYTGEHPPYVVLYLGEARPENERHAPWQSAAPGSTVITFAYRVAAGDVADSVSLKPVGMLVPEGTTVTSAEDKLQAVGSAPQPAPSGESPSTPARETGTPFVTGEGEPLEPTRQDTPVVPYVPVIEEPAREISPVTDVPRSPLVFNELGNGSGDTNDWLELRNVTGSAVSLKEWELSVVQDAKKEDTSLIVFPDVSVPANGLLLLVNTEPEKTLLAAGDDIADTGKNGGSKHLYLVNSGLSLPDDGKFLLILRNAKEKLGLDEAFVDVAGGGGSDTDAFIREQTGLYDTHVWPLQVLEAPGSDTEEALGSGKVWQRAKADIVGYHKDAWAEAAFTGLGYDRQVSKSAATAGTPGYPNVAPKAAAAKGSVTVSEIMVDSAGGTLPQWIELYNKSKTDAVNLNRWKLEIQNVDSEDLVGRPIVTLTLQEKVIQPNQTLLIVAGPARASSGAYLPPDRVYDLLALHEKNLRIKRARDTFLSAEGFYLKLTDRNAQLVDEVGNTDGNRRTKDAPAWPLAMSAEEGVRSSLIRRYTEGTSEAQDGTEKGTWVLAANVKKVVDGQLHWGSAEDIGTPGYRRGGALPVELSSFTLARTDAGAVVLTWTTESEVDNAGFNLRRSEKRNSGFTLINPALIAGAGTTGERQTYTFTDTSAKPGVEYYYQIEEVAFDGKPQALAMRMLRGPVSASNRALTTFGELKAKE